MRSHTNENGFALIMLIGIIAALAILAATLVMMMDNQQHATSRSRANKTSLYYAEAGLNSAAIAVKSTNAWLTASYTDSSSMNQGYNGVAGAPTVTYTVYDNAQPVNTSVHWDANGDGMVWVEADTTFNGRTTKVRELVSSSTRSSILPKAAAYADTSMTLSGSANIFAVDKTTGLPDTSGAPYVTTIMCGKDFTGTSSTTLASPLDGTHTQSLGLQINGTANTPSHNFSPATGGVGLLSDYFDGAHQAALTSEARSGSPTQAINTPTATTMSSSTRTTLQGTSSQNWSAGTTNYYYNGSLTLSAKSGATSSFTFKSLYLTGNLTVTGNVTLKTTALYVGGNFTVSGTSANITDYLGPVYCGGTIDWNGGSSATRLGISTATSSAGVPGPLFAKIFSVDGDSAGNGDYDGSSGPTDIVLGNTWIDGNPGTSDVAVNFSGPSSSLSTVMCPLLATTEQTHVNGNVNFGTLASPMVYYMQCDNDGLYSNTFQYSGTGTYTGLMVLFEAPYNMTSGTVVGAVLEGTPVTPDLTMSGSSSVCYNQTAIDNCTSDTLRTTITSVVVGSWQQLK